MPARPPHLPQKLPGQASLASPLVQTHTPLWGHSPSVPQCMVTASRCPFTIHPKRFCGLLCISMDLVLMTSLLVSMPVMPRRQVMGEGKGRDADAHSTAEDVPKATAVWTPGVRGARRSSRPCSRVLHGPRQQEK